MVLLPRPRMRTQFPSHNAVFPVLCYHQLLHNSMVPPMVLEAMFIASKIHSTPPQCQEICGLKQSMPTHRTKSNFLGQCALLRLVQNMCYTWSKKVFDYVIDRQSATLHNGTPLKLTLLGQCCVSVTWRYLYIPGASSILPLGVVTHVRTWAGEHIRSQGRIA